MTATDGQPSPSHDPADRHHAPALSLAELEQLIRTVPDFPEPGIEFRDITTLLANGAGLRSAVLHLCQKLEGKGIEMIAGIEARGFIFGASVAMEMGLGFIPIRKPGKLPVATIGADYALEYGQDRLELDPSTIEAGTRIAIVDDLIATGGTACAAVELLRKAGGEVGDALFVIDLPDLGGAARLQGEAIATQSLLSFAGA